MAGLEKEKTRSGLYFEGYRILKEVMPKISIIENVKNLTSKRFKNEFAGILKDIEDAGYNNYWRVLNAKDYGVPQNRERVFVVSIRKDIDKCSFNFPDKQFLKIRLKDLLEEKVEDKYYLSDRAIGRLVKYSNRIIRKPENPNVSACLIANYFKMGARDQQYIKDGEVQRIIGLYDDEKEHQAGSIYNENGISPTLTRASGGHVQPHIFVREAVKKKYTEACEGDSINVSYPQNINKRGRVGKQVSQTILASNTNMATLEITDKPICINNIDGKTSVQDRIYDTNGIMPTVTAGNFKGNIAEDNKSMFNPYNQKEITDIAPTQTRNCGNINSSAAVLITEDGKYYFKIRKLTPKECWRLMGFDDIDFEKARQVPTSDTQLYKQAGNSIVVNVLMEIFKKLILEDTTNVRFV